MRFVPGGFARDARGVAMVEFALVAPMFLMTLLGIIGYGGYFWRAHVVQQVANDAARAAIGGLTAPERETLAMASATADFTSLGGIDIARTNTLVRQTSDTVTVEVTYDGARDGFLRLGLVPLPSTSIRRVAAVRLGGL